MGRLLASYKEEMDYPISAILIFDTLLGVGGAAIAGSQARALFGADAVIWFSIVMSMTLLIVSQIIPKIVGVVYCKTVARISAKPISIAISILYPVVWLIERFTRFLKPDEPLRRASEEVVNQMAQISAEEGSILGVESELIQNSLELNDVQAVQIMTPLNQVFMLPANMIVKDAFASFHERVFSRIPIYSSENRDQWVDVVLSRDLLSEMARDHDDVELGSIAKRLYSVSAETPGHVLLNAFLKNRSHLFGVQDQGKGMIGVVSLEDVIEEILGKEIIDERENKTAPGFSAS
jgi:CBS domain containing-hemolysin-like protein